MGSTHAQKLGKAIAEVEQSQESLDVYIQVSWPENREAAAFEVYRIVAGVSERVLPLTEEHRQTWIGMCREQEQELTARRARSGWHSEALMEPEEAPKEEADDAGAE